MAAPDTTRAILLERILAFCTLTFASGVFYAGFTPIISGDIGARAGESIAYQGIWLVLYSLLALCVAMRAEMMMSIVVRNALVFLLVGVYLASEIANAGIPGAVVRIISLVLTIIFSAWFSRVFSLDDIVTMFTRVFVVVICAHIAILLIFGTPYIADPLHRSTLLGVQAHSGLFPHKNDAGLVFCIATVLFTSKIFYSERNRWACIIGAIVSALLLLLAGATGSVVAALAGLVVIGSLLAFNRFWGMIFCALGSIVVLPLMFVDDDTILGFFGRSENLTGRTVIWSWWPEFFSEHPWIGLGYSGFFNPGGAAVRLWDKLPDKYQAVNFHNSFLDVGIQTGILGLLLMILIVVVGLSRSGILAVGTRRKYGVIPLALLVPLVLYASIEFAIPAHNNFATIVFFIMYFKSAQLYRGQSRGGRYSVLKRLRDLNLSRAGRAKRRVGGQIGAEQG